MANVYGYYKSRVEAKNMIKQFSLDGRMSIKEIIFQISTTFGFTEKMINQFIFEGTNNGIYTISDGKLIAMSKYMAKKYEEDLIKKETDNILGDLGEPFKE